ncbi:MAG TPA: ion transporter [Chryseosolibacter sp.]
MILKSEKKEGLRHKVYNLLNPLDSGTPVARLLEAGLLLLIFLNMLILILESEQEINSRYGHIFVSLEFFSVLIFTVEYGLRLWSCVENPKYMKGATGRLRYMGSTMAIIDLLAILPFYLTFIVAYLPFDLIFIRMIRLFRLFRLLKVARYLKALNLIQTVLRERKEQIYLSVMFIGFLLIIISTLMFYVEHDAQPKVFSSIPASMWWGIETLTTVGYGDMLPMTALGKVLGGMISVLGIGLFALPAGILSSGLTEHLQKNGKKSKPKRCPHCGGPIHD